MPNWRELKPSLLYFYVVILRNLTKLKSKGVNFIEEPKKMAWGTYAKFIDIDGNEFLMKG
jgi:lactoylglutathione lyase